jgi:hypothetical protein
MRFQFSIPPEFVGKLSKHESDPLPRFELQMRMAVYDAENEQQDAFPQNVKVSINGFTVTLPVSSLFPTVHNIIF